MDDKRTEELRRVADDTIRAEVAAATEILAFADNLLEQLLAEAYELYLQRTANRSSSGGAGELQVAARN